MSDQDDSKPNPNPGDIDLAVNRIIEAHSILESLDFPRAQLNDRSALTLLALLNVKPNMLWADAQNPLIGITPIMAWCLEHYGRRYAPNTRETFRRQTMHQFVEAGLVLANPDNQNRPINSPKWSYQMEFSPRFAPAGQVLYVGDTGEKWAYFDENALRQLGVEVDSHGKMPDVVIHLPTQNWLLLIEAVTSHGPVDGKRYDELSQLFGRSTAGLVFVTAFPTRALMARYVSAISWQTEVWVADAPDHLIHFDGERFLGPYQPPLSEQ